jgi:flavin reductase (DIM6/NTAB) family NADH-FMN oxidoreductase RutF
MFTEIEHSFSSLCHYGKNFNPYTEVVFSMKKSLGARTLASLTPVWLIGTYDKEGKPNLMAAAWVGICCSKPPCVAVSLRKATYTYGNIVERKALTANIPSEAYIRESDYAGIASGRDVDKFSSLKLTPVKSDITDAPYVEECQMVLECKVIHTIEIGLHTKFVCEILDVKADSSVLNSKGLPDMEKIKQLLFDTGNRSYYGVGSCIGQAFSIGKDIK